MSKPTVAMSAPLGKSVLIYTCAFAVAGVTPFLMLPILTKYLSPEQFGEATAFLMLTAILGNVAGLSAHGFVSVRFFKTTPAEFKGIVSSGLGAIGVSHLLAAAAVALLYPLLRTTLGVPLPMAMLAVGTALAINLNLISLAIFQSSSQPLLYLRARLVQGLLEFSLCLALIHLFQPDAGARAYSYAFAISASATLGLFHCFKHGNVGTTIQTRHLRALAAFGIPMLPHVVAGSAIVYLDRLVVSTVLGSESLGIYMVATQIGMAMVALIEPLNKALAPWLFGQLAKNDEAVRRTIVKRTYLLYVALTLMGVLVAAVSYLLFDRLISARFAAARALIPWMVAGFVLQGMYYSVVNYMFYAEKTGRLSVFSATTAALGCAVSYALTSTFGLLGAAISFAFNNAALFLLVWLAASRAVPMPWSLR